MGIIIIAFILAAVAGWAIYRAVKLQAECLELRCGIIDLKLEQDNYQRLVRCARFACSNCGGVVSAPYDAPHYAEDIFCCTKCMREFYGTSD